MAARILSNAELATCFWTMDHIGKYEIHFWPAENFDAQWCNYDYSVCD
jgi:hypothetical protein